MKMLLPVLMAGIIGLLGMVISLFLTLQRTSFNVLHWSPLFTNNTSPLIVSQSNFSLYLGSIFLGAGLCMGVCGLSAGICIGILTDAGIRAYAQQPKLFTILIIMLIFAEVLTIYGFIISILLIFRGSSQQC